MARPRLGDGETERLHVKISTEELVAVDEWAWENRIRSKSEAVRRLIQIGLLADKELFAAADAAEKMSRRADELIEIFTPQLITFDELMAQDEETPELSRAFLLGTSGFSKLNELNLFVQDLAVRIMSIASAIAPFVSSPTVGGGSEKAAKSLENMRKYIDALARIRIDKRKWTTITEAHEIAEAQSKKVLQRSNTDVDASRTEDDEEAK